MNNSSSKTLRLTHLSLLTAVALVIFVFEINLPPLTAVPGVKMGLANIVTLATYYLYDRKSALLVLVSRVILGAAFTGRLSTLPYSMVGGLLCFAITALLLPWFPLKRMWLLSIIGAVFHNIGQIVVAILILETPEILWYLPVLLFSGLISGFFTGHAAQFLLQHLRRMPSSAV